MDKRPNPCHIHFSRKVYTAYHNAWHFWLCSFSKAMTVWLVLYSRLVLMRSAADKDYASLHWKPRFKSLTRPKGWFQPECNWLTDPFLLLFLILLYSSILLLGEVSHENFIKQNIQGKKNYPRKLIISIRRWNKWVLSA